MMQRYNVLFPRHLESEIDDALEHMAEEFPDAVIVRRKHDFVTIDCPIWTEGLFVQFFEDEDCRIAKNHIYSLSAIAKESGND